MQILVPFLRLHLLLRTLWKEFLPWYFFKQPVNIVKLYGAYAKTFLQIFSFLFLLKTLFSPWKSIADEYPSNHLDIKRMTQVFALNCTARGVGFVVRSLAIILGMVVQAALFCVFVFYFFFWIAFPLIAALGIQLIYLSFPGT